MAVGSSLLAPAASSFRLLTVPATRALLECTQALYDVCHFERSAMKLSAKLFLLLSVVLLALTLRQAPAVDAGNSPAGQDTVLKAADISNKIFPEQVFFRGKVAPAQLRNAGGVHFADDF